MFGDILYQYIDWIPYFERRQDDEILYDQKRKLHLEEAAVKQQYDLAARKMQRQNEKDTSDLTRGDEVARRKSQEIKDTIELMK